VHAVHDPAQGRSQHTPSARLPLAHALADVDGWPLSSAQAAEPLQVEPVMQFE
jgi:hypothetical protein